MPAPSVHLDGPRADHVSWSVDTTDDAFDGAALEQAMVEARREAYQALSDLDAA